jgi:hypothetical protein
MNVNDLIKDLFAAVPASHPKRKAWAELLEARSAAQERAAKAWKTMRAGKASPKAKPAAKKAAGRAKPKATAQPQATV